MKNFNYNSFLYFTNSNNGKSFCLTANFTKNEKLEFSICYNRPKKVKILFGFLGEKEKMVVGELWSLDFEKAMNYLEFFVNGNYATMEELYNK